MSSEKTHRFPLIDEYMARRMEVHLSAVDPGHVEVVESPRRLHREQSYGFIHALWWIRIEDGRSAASVPPGAGDAVKELLPQHIRSGEELFDEQLAERLKTPVDAALRKAGLKRVDRVLTDMFFGCNAELLRKHGYGECRRLTDESVPPAQGLSLPVHCFPDGNVHGVVVDGEVVSIAFAHHGGCMEDQVADLGVSTAPPHRRCRYAKTAVSAVVLEITRNGGQARYACRPDNAASIATARSVGFVPYGTSMILSAPARDTGEQEGPNRD